ncbi:hypothetical protein [Oceanicella sp. SM1341]|uniref:hypothetical protein n=1 Tax=Oceanicella sp. SM1341 TaxID=1548889 RepID=UPI000E555F41|nr:hypothetical protein [Oceanicella sp. SM1341]
MRHTALPLVAPLALLAACAGPPPSAGTVRASSVDTHGGIGRWTTGESYTIAYAVTRIGGRTAVCGGWSYFGNAVSIHYAELLRNASLEIDGETVMDGLGFFNAGGPMEPGNIDSLLNCAFSDVPWRAEFEEAEPEFVSRQHVFG